MLEGVSGGVGGERREEKVVERVRGEEEEGREQRVHESGERRRVVYWSHVRERVSK